MQSKESLGTSRRSPQVCRTWRITARNSYEWWIAIGQETSPPERVAVVGVLLPAEPFVGFCSKLQSNVVLSSTEAELNSSVKGLSEMIGIFHLYQEFFGRDPVCRYSLMPALAMGCCCAKEVARSSISRPNNFGRKGAIQSYGIAVEKIPRSVDAADALTDSLTFKEMMAHLKTLGFDK